MGGQWLGLSQVGWLVAKASSVGDPGPAPRRFQARYLHRDS